MGKFCLARNLHLEDNEYVQKFADFNQISPAIALRWILSWQIKNKKDFFEEVAKKNNKWRVFNDVINNRLKEFYNKIKPTKLQFARRFNNLHRDLSSLQITDAIQLIEHLCYELYNEYNKNGVYQNMEEYLSKGELGLYDDIYEALSYALTPDEDGDYVMHPLFHNEDYPDEDIVITKEQAELLLKALRVDNFDTLWHLFKINAKTTLGVTIGLEKAIGTSLEEIGDYLDVLEKGENDENTYFNYEESTKEAWLNVKEFIKPMKQLSKSVRRMISHIPQYDKNGRIALSTFGVPRFESPHVIHRKLSSSLLGVRSEEQMIEWLKEQEHGIGKQIGDKQISYILQLIDSDFTLARALAENDLTEDELNMLYESEHANATSLRTLLFQDMQKGGMAYAVTKIKRKGKQIWQSITFINTASSLLGNLLWQGYRSMLASKRNIIANEETLFDDKGMLKTGALRTAKSIAEGLKVKEVNREESKNYAQERTEDFFNQLSLPLQTTRILAALRALGIPYNIDNINRLLRGTHKDKYKLVGNLYDAFNFIYGDGTRKEDSSMINALTVSTQGKWSANKSMSQILRIANENNMMAQSVFRMSGSYMNPTKGFVEYQTAQLRGFMSDMFEDIRQARVKTLAEDNIKIEIINGKRVKSFKVNYVHKYIEDHFFQDPMFIEYEPQTDDEGNPILDKDNNPVKPSYKYEIGTKKTNGRPKIRHPWLRELWINAENIENLSSPNSLINQFQHYLFVGSQKDNSDESATTSNADWRTWEDFNGIQHMSLLMNAFVQAYRTDDIGSSYKDDYADYPTFILGDSGKLKFIRSRRYNVRGEKGETVMKHLKETVMLEVDFAKNQYDFLLSLIQQGYKPIKQMPLSKLMVEYPNGKIFYRIQSFPEINQLLHDKAIENNVDFTQSQEYVASKLAEILDGNLNDWLTNIMANKFDEFKEKCRKEGVLLTQSVKKKVAKNTYIEYDVYPYLPLGKDSGYAWKTDGTTESLVENEQELNRFLEDYYYNSTLAMINLIQMFTLSPAFYPNSVEMLKRMKQIHANGKRPSLDALDRYGRPYMMRNGRLDTNMDYILLNDVLGNPSQYYNEDFMDSVAYTHGRYSEEYYRFLAQNPDVTESLKEEKAIEIGKLSSQYKTFAATSYTDGQGYRTLEGYRKIKGALGEWSRQDEGYYRRILEIRKKHQDGTEWTKLEKMEVARMLASWQPIKPFVYGMLEIQQVTEGVGRKVRIPTQIKCSECLIIPELLPAGSKLKTVVEYLEDQYLDCAYYDSCIKVGAFGQAETTYKNNPDNQVEFDELGKPTEDSGIWNNNLKKGLKNGQTFELMNNDQLKAILNGHYRSLSPMRHSLSYEYYVELNSVPEHTYNSRTIGTQLRKIFFDGLNLFELDEHGNPTGKMIDYSHYVDGNLVTLPSGEKATLASKEQLIKFYSSLHCANVLAQFEGIVDIIKNDETLSKELQKVALNSTNEQLNKLIMYAVHQSLVDPDQREFGLPLFENSLEHDAAATLISIFRKASTQLLIQGGSLVQASAYGIENVEFQKESESHKRTALKVKCDKNHNILYSECEVPFAQEYTDKFGNKVKLKFEDWCDKDGNLKRDKNGIALLEKAFPGSTEMVCYRIPSEKDYSAVVLRVKRFTKPIEGGIIRLPVQITSITGADFDIDKMFLMRPQYVQRQDATTLEEFISETYKDEFLGKVWEDIYSGNYFGTNGESIRLALSKCLEDWMRHNGISDPEDSRVPALNKFWDLALEENPDAFLGKDGDIYINKQEFFEAAVQQINPDFSKDVNKRFNKSWLYKWHTYDYNKSVDQQERDKNQKSLKTDVIVRNNMMLQLIKKRLQDPQTMRSRTTPGGFVDAENAAEDIRYTVYADKSYIKDNEFDWERFQDLKDKPDPNESLNYADPFTLVEYNKLNQIAAKLVGTFANLNSFKQMLNSLEDVTLAKRPIRMFGRSVTSLARLSAQDIKEGRNPSLYVAEMLAAAVDSVKNPTLKFLNITLSTAYVAGLMAMAGFTHREIGIFLNQPIVKEVTNYCELNSCGLTTAIKAIVNQYYAVGGLPRMMESEGIYGPKLTEGRLLENLVGGEDVNSLNAKVNDAAFMNYQFSVLSALQHLTDTSLSLKQYVSASKMTSANSIQSTYGSLYNIIQSAENLNQISKEDAEIILFPYSNKSGVTSPINPGLNTEDNNYMDQVLDSVFPIEQVIYDVVKKFIDKTHKFFPYNNNVYKSTREFFRTANNKKTEAVLSAKTIDSIHKYVQNWCLLNLPDCPSLFGGATIEVGALKYPVRTYFLHVFPTEFKRFLDAHAEEYPTLYRCLTVDENKRIILNYGFNRDSDKDAFTAEWRNLINNNGSTVSNRLNVGTALYFYNYHASKFNFGSTTFDHLMPQDKLPDIVIGYKLNFVEKTLIPITYKDALDYIKDNNFGDTNDEFRIMFLRDNYNNNELVKQIYNYDLASHFGDTDIIISVGNSKSANTYEFLKIAESKDDGTVTYPLAVHVNNKIYIATNTSGLLQNTIPIGLNLVYKVYSTEYEDKGMKMNEENMPIEGTFLEPISWSTLQSMSTESISYDIVDGLLNNMIEVTRGDEINIHEYLDFCRDLIRDLKRNNIKVDTVQLVLESFKALLKAYNSYSNSKVLSAEDTAILKLTNAVTVLQTFIDVMCPGINKLTGEQRADIYDMIVRNFTDEQGEINIDNYTLEDLKATVTDALLLHQVEIELNMEAVRKTEEIFEILLSDKGESPLLPNNDNEVKPLCRG